MLNFALSFIMQVICLADYSNLKTDKLIFYGSLTHKLIFKIIAKS